MGALPSRETHRRGLYSHRHGRNRRSEIVLIPLTTDFFPSPDCPLFQHLYRARQRRTAKYYFRALRSTETSHESDYYCTTSAVNEPGDFERHNTTRLREEELRRAQARAVSPNAGPQDGREAASAIRETLFSASPGSKTGSPALASAGSAGTTATAATTAQPLSHRAGKGTGGVVGAGGKKPAGTPEDYEFESYADSAEGLWQVLIGDNNLGLFETDEELRQAYLEQVQTQRAEWERLSQQFKFNPANPVSNPVRVPAGSAGSPTSGAPANGNANTAAAAGPGGADHGNAPPPPPPSSVPMVNTGAFENVPFDAFLSGYAAAKRYMQGKPKHTYTAQSSEQKMEAAQGRVNSAATGSAAGGNGAAQGGGGGDNEEDGTGARPLKHVTSPAAYYVRPIPCAIASRYDSNKPPPVDDPLYVKFQGFYVKIMGMFGLFPATVTMRHADVGGNSSGSEPTPKRRRRFPRKEGNSNADEDINVDEELEQHLLKGTMFVDRDVGDQILGNMVMLAAHMYIRQCVEVHIQPQYIPMLPLFIRAPLSNIPMLQFFREFRVRLHSLINAGTAKSGRKPFHVGMSGFNPEDIAEPHNPAQQRHEEEAYLYEDDIPCATTSKELFHDFGHDAPLHRTNATNTNQNGDFPIMMMSGFNVQSIPLRHPALNLTANDPQRRSSQPHPAKGGGKNSKSSQSPMMTPTVTSAASAANHHSRAGPPLSPGSASGNQTPGSRAVPTFNSPNTFGMPDPHSTPEVEARKTMLLLRRKNRFRIWVEDGHLCIWASAAYTRRGCLLLSQQLNTTVDSNAVPEQRAWRYRGLIHAGTVIPPPQYVNDAFIIAEDMPSVGLWQGDVLRCCTVQELHAVQGGTQLPLPFEQGGVSGKIPPDAGKGSPTSEAAAAAAASGTAAPGANASNTTTSGTATTTTDAGVTPNPAPIGLGATSTANYTSNHVSNPLLKDQNIALPGSFWVRGSGGLDDSFINTTQSNMPPNPKMEKQLQQAALQRAKKAAATAALVASKSGVGSGSGSGKHGSGSTSTADTILAMAAAAAAASDFLDIDRCEGTMNLEEIVLAWIKVVSILTRDATEEDEEWVRDPDGNPVRIDRYVIRRYEHDGVRYFIGVTPRFVGQQRRIEKVLGEVYALEEREEQRKKTGAGANGHAAHGTLSAMHQGQQHTILAGTANHHHRVRSGSAGDATTFDFGVFGTASGSGRLSSSAVVQQQQQRGRSGGGFSSRGGGRGGRAPLAPGDSAGDDDDEEANSDLLEQFERDQLLFADD